MYNYDQLHFCKSIYFVLTNIKCGSSPIGLWWLLLLKKCQTRYNVHDIKSLDQSATNWLTLASKYLNPTLPSVAPGGGNLGQFPWSVEVMTPCWLLAEYRKCSRAHSALASSNPKLSPILQTFAKGFIHSRKMGYYCGSMSFDLKNFLRVPMIVRCEVAVVIVTLVYKQLTLISSKLTHQKNGSWAITDPPIKRRKVNGNSPKGSPLFCKTSLTTMLLITFVVLRWN